MNEINQYVSDLRVYILQSKSKLLCNLGQMEFDLSMLRAAKLIRYMHHSIVVSSGRKATHIEAARMVCKEIEKRGTGGEDMVARDSLLVLNACLLIAPEEFLPNYPDALSSTSSTLPIDQ